MMKQFIHSNYPESISLLDIAKVGEVSISTALNLFRNVLNTSPVNYLICYRLRKAALLLTNTEKKVSAISIETGFSNTDYFCKTFKRMYSLTPTEYRNVKK
jgi:AraC-like DNA-binding protein